MNVAIIAAGEGSRLRAEGVSTPKPLIKIHGVPLIERIIGLAVQNGASAIHCIINEQSPALQEYLFSRDFGIDVDVMVRSTPSSMHSLFALAPRLRHGPFCLMTVDAVFREDEFRQFLSHTAQQGNLDGILAVTRFIDDEKPLCVAMDTHRRILAFNDTKKGFVWATGGLYYFSPQIFDAIETAMNRNIKRLRNFLRLLLEKGYKLEGYPFSKIVAIDHAQDVRVAEQFLRE
ncbi:NTP transferase domain-containing protein [Candidatus Poribacteria bacterium]|nr:NTP transferase domain-containing protein [Candidatus Poribacteria bacterium]